MGNNSGSIIKECQEAMHFLDQVVSEEIWDGPSEKPKKSLLCAYEILNRLCGKQVELDAQQPTMSSSTSMLWYRALKQNVFVATIDEDHSEDVIVGNRTVCFWDPRTKAWCEDSLFEFEPPKKGNEKNEISRV